MPIPKPNSDESEKAFMGRCMSFLKDEGKPHEQAIAICMKSWRGEDAAKALMPDNRVIQPQSLEGARKRKYKKVVRKRLRKGLVPVVMLGRAEEPSQ